MRFVLKPKAIHFTYMLPLCFFNLSQSSVFIAFFATQSHAWGIRAKACDPQPHFLEHSGFDFDLKVFPRASRVTNI